MMEKKTHKKRNGGTREWAEKTVNCCTGCTHNCRYCYARDNAVRYKQLTADQWPNERIRPHDVNRGRRKKFPEWVMFPSSHDITPTNMVGCIVFLEKLLRVGNQVLVVSKPHLDCIEAVCEKFGNYQGQILFRFTIGACDGSVLSFWEPGAPGYAERKASLEHAFRKGFQTSVSIEPMLDTANIDYLVADLMPFVSESIWIGKMNHINNIAKYVDEPTRKALAQLDAGQSDAIIKLIYERHKNNPMIKWKESIRAVVGI
jgi:DNA repair photolyase